MDIKHIKKGIRTRSINRFLKSEYEKGAGKESEGYDDFARTMKPHVNSCKQCGIKYWNEKRCKCDLI